KLPSMSTRLSLEIPQRRASELQRRLHRWLLEETFCGSEGLSAFVRLFRRPLGGLRNDRTHGRAHSGQDRRDLNLDETRRLPPHGRSSLCAARRATNAAGRLALDESQALG